MHPRRSGRVSAGDHPRISANNQHRSAVVDVLRVKGQERQDNPFDLGLGTQSSTSHGMPVAA